jgi:AraC family transcriptional regulator
MLFEPSGRARPDTQAFYKTAVEQVIRTMRARPEEELSLERMAEIAGTSPFHFLRIFRQLTGVPPVHFLSALRLAEAKRLLLSTDRSVTDICFEVGYNSLGTFTTRFTQLVGLPPARLRRLGRAFRCEVLAALPERLRAASAEPGPFAVAGCITADEAAGGLIFLGLFQHPIPQERPLACALLTSPGPYRLQAPAPGRYFVFAARFSRTSDPAAYLLAGHAACQVAASGPVMVRAFSKKSATADLHLVPPSLFDPPLLVALPLLAAERLAA